MNFEFMLNICVKHQLPIGKQLISFLANILKHHPSTWNALITQIKHTFPSTDAESIKSYIETFWTNDDAATHKCFQQ